MKNKKITEEEAYQEIRKISMQKNNNGRIV